MKALKDYPIDDLKRCYRHLHSQLQGDPEMMDSELLDDLQKLLQNRARDEDVDVSLHSAWSAWLGEDSL